ncbi:MAG: hypothetical protein KJP19_09540, partial [Deltaproteobacteria bacterium]|nr:hypothetical protein [Deltaproteobacteria bacterium]
KKLGGGSQLWRTVSLQFSPDAIYWGTDSPQNKNHIFKLQWSSHQKEILLTVRNPFYYSCQDSNQNIYFSTTVERPEIDGSERYSEIWQLNSDNLPRKLVKWQKAGKKCYGEIHFAQGTPIENLLSFTPTNLKGHHYEALVAELSQL